MTSAGDQHRKSRAAATEAGVRTQLSLSAGLIAVAPGPTDAALSESVIDDERLPARVRRVLNVESGLNDGIATPVVTFCIAAAATALGVVGNDFDDGFGALGQLTVGAVGRRRGRVGRRPAPRLRPPARPGCSPAADSWPPWPSRCSAFLVASEAGGNPFVSAFVGGLVFGWSARADAVEAVELTELGGNLLSLALWFIFGAGFVIPAFEDLDARIVTNAVVSLTLVRMVPVALALIGARQGRATVAFVGWFGPRGLASVVFALLAIEELGGTDPRVIVAVNTIAVTIVFSVIAHGITARPLATRYLAALDDTQRTSANAPASRPIAETERPDLRSLATGVWLLPGHGDAEAFVGVDEVVVVVGAEVELDPVDLAGEPAVLGGVVGGDGGAGLVADVGRLVGGEDHRLGVLDPARPDRRRRRSTSVTSPPLASPPPS